ncbi:(E2-independent) E3 ubiquitin-conjugating enzyme FATS [Labeo rohita]|uniref:(E2-independent) E3 ubiquitin-conjugating enzyme FATS n=1 Tax=Labeo rohita TaxID=84645 RepID=A0ABQ8M2C0_LABRO|nr:(E2-independent) E3 ubiquitin-conjugating enzyme FATS [Labeo rohita]
MQTLLFAFTPCRLSKCGVQAKPCFFCQGCIPAFPVWGFICSGYMLAIAAKDLKSACDLFNHFYVMCNLRVALRTCSKRTRATADVCIRL